MLDGLAAMPGLRVVPSAAGLHVTARLAEGVDDVALVAAAAAEGVAVEALSSYAAGAGGPRGLVLGYGATVTASIRPGLRRLARLLASAPSR